MSGSWGSVKVLCKLAHKYTFWAYGVCLVRFRLGNPTFMVCSGPFFSYSLWPLWVYRFHLFRVLVHFLLSRPVMPIENLCFGTHATLFIFFMMPVLVQLPTVIIRAIFCILWTSEMRVSTRRPGSAYLLLLGVSKSFASTTACCGQYLSL